MGQVVEADVLGRPLLSGEHAQFAPGRVDRLVERAVRVLQRDLPVVGAVGDQEGHGDLLDDAVEMHVVGD